MTQVSPKSPILFITALVALYALPIAYFLFAGSLGGLSHIVEIAMFAIVLIGSFAMVLVILGSRIDSRPRVVRRPDRRSTDVGPVASTTRDARR